MGDKVAALTAIAGVAVIAYTLFWLTNRPFK